MRPARRRTPEHRLPAGTIGENRESWVQVNGHEFILYRSEPDRDESVDDADGVTDQPSSTSEPLDSDGPEYPHFTRVRIAWRKPGSGNPNVMSLANLTAAELEAMRTFFNRAFDMARPICEQLDAHASEAWEAGNDSFARIYRPVPHLVIRNELKPPNRKSVPSGLDATLGIPGGAHGSPVADSDAGVLRPEQERVGTDDDSP